MKTIVAGRNCGIFVIACVIFGSLLPATAAAVASPAHTGGVARPAAKPTSSPESAACLSAIKRSETERKLAPRLLEAIGMVESGRPDRVSGRVAPWPWTINVAGKGYFFDTKAAAITAVEAAQAAGVASIDVGCMQVNLLQHPQAFASLDDAFEPPVNAAYAGRFLQRLQASLGSWPAAAAAYHSMTPELGADYIARVSTFWPEAAPYTLEMAQLMARATSGQAPGQFNVGAPGFATQSLAKALRPPYDAMARIDPLHLMTAEYRARIAADAQQRTARYAAMGLLPQPALVRPARSAAPPMNPPTAAARPRADRVQARLADLKRTAWR